MKKVKRIAEIFIITLIAVLTLSGCTGSRKTAVQRATDFMPTPSEEKITDLSVDKAIDRGMALVVGRYDDGLSIGYNFAAIDGIMKKPGQVFITGFLWNTPDPESCFLYCVINSGHVTTLTTYLLNDGVYTAEVTRKVKLVKKKTVEGILYCAVQGDGRSIGLIDAKEIIAPSSPKDCVGLYEEAMMKRNGITQYFLSPQKTRKTFDKTMWVTGVSSPHIKAYSVGASSRNGDKTLVSGTLTWELSGSPDSTDKLVYTVICEENSFRIDQMTDQKKLGD